MFSLKEWLKAEKRIKKKKEKANEPRGNQTNGESGNEYQQGQTAGANTQVPQQTVHLFPIPEL
jgi:hypothetical protein